MTDASHLPEEQILRPGTTKWKWMLWGSGAFAAIGAVMVASGETVDGGMALAFFGVCTALSAFMLYSRNQTLTLRSDGFEVRHMGRNWSYAWQDVSEFKTWHRKQSGITYMKAVTFSPLNEKGSLLKTVNKKLAGNEGSLPDTYGMDGEELAELMNAYRRQAIGA